MSDPMARVARPEPPVEREPSAVELAAIEREWPLIEAELELLDTEISLIRRQPSGWDWRRYRRAQRRVLEARRALATPTEQAVSLRSRRAA